jgi:hypothetical protein
MQSQNIYFVQAANKMLYILNKEKMKFLSTFCVSGYQLIPKMGKLSNLTP